MNEHATTHAPPRPRRVSVRWRGWRAWSLTVGLTALGLAFLAGGARAEHGGNAHEGGGHGASFDAVNWWHADSHAPPLGWFLIDFAIFAGGLVYFSARPLSTFFAQRHLRIKGALDDAATAHAKAAGAQRQWKERSAQVDAEARELLAQSQRDGLAEQQHLVREAKHYGERLEKDGSSIAEQELQRARERLRHALLKAALGKATALLEANLQADDRARLVEDAIAQLESDSPLEGTRGRPAALPHGGRA